MLAASLLGNLSKNVETRGRAASCASTAAAAAPAFSTSIYCHRSFYMFLLQ